MTAFECVPNFSSADAGLMDELAELVEGCDVLVADRTSDPDHNRSVLTWLGHAADLRRAAGRATRFCAEHLSLSAPLSTHRGIHPRTGLLDVLPWVPLNHMSPFPRGAEEPSDRDRVVDSTLEAAHEESVRCARDLARDFDLPIFLYEAAAIAAERRNLASHRAALLPGWPRSAVARGPVQQIPTSWPPDFGPPHPHPLLGVTLVGARAPLVAFNLDLRSAQKALAVVIATRIRGGSPGGLPGVKALGLKLETRGCAQVSVNLVDTRATTLPQLVQRVVHEAGRLGAQVASSELIGLATLEAVDGASASDLLLPELSDRHFVEFHLSRWLEGR